MNDLYMTTEEFAAMIVDTLDEQNYFKKDSRNHPVDIVAAFITAAETIGTAMEWAIKRQHQVVNEKKHGVMSGGDLRKADQSKKTQPTYSTNNVLPALLQEGEQLISEESLGYSEWKRDGYL